jgi:hypothetical protein
MSNLILTPTPVNSVTVAAGSSLFAVAAAYLGDATKWNQISDMNPALNGDPLVTQVTTLSLPTDTIESNGGLIGR